MVALSSPAFGQDAYTEIGSAFDERDPFDLHVSVDWHFEAKKSAIKREFTGHPLTDPNGPPPIARDLLYRGRRHVLTPKVRMGVFKDIELSVALPLILTDSYALEFDQSADPCILPGDPNGQSTCINRLNSSTLIDGILPSNGFDADDPTGPGFVDPDDPTIFRGTTRKGIDQIHLGLAWAPMHQKRDRTKPTWVLGSEVRLGIGKPKVLDRARPDKATAAGRGLHELRLFTSMAKRVSWAEPFFEAWWQAPIGTTDDSQFIEVKFGAERESAQQIAGTRFGFQGLIWEKAEAAQRASLEFSATLESHFEGRAYTEMWEVFQFAGDADAGGPLVIDADPEMAGVQGLSHPGVTNVENYLVFAGRFGVNVHLGEKVRFGASFDLRHDQSHLITFADAGIDLPQCSGGATEGCEAANNDTVDPGTPEVNPYHVQTIDVSGHRYRVGDSVTYGVIIGGLVLF